MNACGTRAALVIAVMCSGCGDDRRTAPGDKAPERAALGGEIAARVGSETIPAALVAKVAEDQQTPPREALRRLLDDAIAANAARAKGLDARPPGSWNLTAARARFTAEKLLLEARAKGPPTDDEIRELSSEHWREVDRPPALRAVHALAVRPKAAGNDARAREVALALHSAALAAPTPEAFLEKTQAVAHPPEVEVVVQGLPGFVEDGRTIDGEKDKMDDTFVRAAFALDGGATSGVVETRFGWHVIRVVERLPEQRMPWETRRLAFTQAAHAARAKRALDAALAAQRASTPVTVAPSAEQLMREAMRGPSP